MVGQRACLLLLLVLATAGLGGAATVPSHRARVPAPLALRGGSGVADVGLGTVPGAEVKEAQKPLPDVRVDNIAKFNNWDHRECCVGNAHEWKEYMHEFIKQDLPDIPKKIHQIWIGPKQPPIIWCDSWRKRYREQYPGWEYKLWTDKEVAALKLRTQEFYDHEQMFQCKADLLRLEVLWNEGGVYIDADMVWLHKDLQDVLDAGKDTGFFCGYEPDTKDKPYSVIGNSFIACTPKHPLVDMLIKYISAIYHHKRPYHGVEWVTGPLAFTKCISHSQMPWFVPPQVWFYPKFHYVPNPDAINLGHFPDSYAFQFGYTCSGLEGWVANSINRISVDQFWIDRCPQLRDRHWEMGRIRQWPETLPTGQPDRIPKVIHQFAFTGEKPERIIRSWAEDFCKANQGWSYQCHSWFPDLKGEFFGCSMYSPKPWGMEPVVMELFALEILCRQGGYHVPLCVPWSKETATFALPAPGDTAPIVMPSLDPSSATSCFSEAALAAGFVREDGLGIVGASAGAAPLMRRIRELLDKCDDPVSGKELLPRCLVPMDAQTAYLQFPQWTRFLGAQYIFDVCDSPQNERDAVAWGYDSEVPAYGLPSKNIAALKGVAGRYIAVTNPDLYKYRSLLDSVGDFIKELDEKHGADGWHVMCLVLQWKAGHDRKVLIEALDASLPEDYRFVGFVANAGVGDLLPDLAAIEKKGLDGLFPALLQMTENTVAGKPVKVAMGTRQWHWDSNDHRAGRDS